MKNAVDKFEDSVNNVKELYFKTVCDEEMLKCMDADTLKLMQASMDVIDASLELTVKQAKTIEEVNNKLDVLVQKFETLGA